jgi:hypothetical protein
MDGEIGFLAEKQVLLKIPVGQIYVALQIKLSNTSEMMKIPC